MLRIGTARRDDGRMRVDLFASAMEAESQGHSSSESFIPSGNAAAVTLAPGLTPDTSTFNYARTLLQWRKETPVLHHGKTLHFLPEDNTYAYFRYDDASVVMVFLNFSENAVQVPWERFQEITDGLGEGRDILSGTTVKAGQPMNAGAREALILQFTRQI